MGSLLDFCDGNDERQFERLRERFGANRDSVFVFVGAGLSRSACQFWQEHGIVGGSGFDRWDRKFPFWNNLIKKMAGLIPADTQELEEFVREHDAIDVAQLIKQRAPQDYRNLIHDALYILPQDLPKEVPPAHAALIKLQPKTLVTSNLDELLEIYYPRIHGCPLPVVFDPPGLTSGSQAPTQLIKMHGTISREDSWVMTRDEYVGIWQTKEAILRSLRYLLEQATCLLVGYSMRDTHVNALYDAILREQSANLNKLNFSVTRGPVNRLTREYWQSRGLNLIGLKKWDGLAELFERLW